VILKGGSEAKNSNIILYKIIVEASEAAGIPSGWVQLASSRHEVMELLELDDYVDLMIPRGSNEFVKYIQENTKIPVLGHAAGICHVYVHEGANLDMAERISLDAKCQYPAVCNAMETLLVDEKVAEEFLPRIWKKYNQEGVTVKGDGRACQLMNGIKEACESDWETEYNDLVLNVKVVSDLTEAVDWINTHGSHHTDSIVTTDEKAAHSFIASVDSSSVMWNASTRFSDGYRYGLGAEVGISTNKIHARGPVGLEGLLIHKWILVGKGQTVGDYDRNKFKHRQSGKEWI
jgi:glutamate-5-semialdehyde dehydrogenase